MTATATSAAPTPATVVAPEQAPGRAATVGSVAARSVLKITRSPQIFGIAIVQSIVFLLMFRYVIGGAIGVGGLDYVEFLVPGFVVSGLVFTAGGGAVGTAEDAASGLFDRLRSLPISDSAVLFGRAVADSGLMVVVGIVTLIAGFIVGFRLHCSAGAVVAALALLVVYAFAVACVFMLLGLVSGSAQAAQGLGILGVPFSFISSAFVPISTMPDPLQVVAEAQPLTFMINSWRGLLLGDPATATFSHGLSYYVIGSLLWCVGLVAVSLPLALRSYRKE